MVREDTKLALRKLGLKEAQIKIYLAALELGQASVQEIARKAGLKRTTVYNFLEDLKNKQLLREVKRRKRSVYTAAHPEHLFELEKSRMEDLRRALPELLAVQNKQKSKPRMAFYEGAEGIQEIVKDSLQTKNPIVSWSWHDPKKLKEIMGRLYDEYPLERARRNILMRSIWRNGPEGREEVKNDRRFLRETKLIDVESKADVMIYDSKIVMFGGYSSTPFAVLIEDPDLADTLRTIWGELWKRL